jgi:hypothetical protein
MQRIILNYFLVGYLYIFTPHLDVTPLFEVGIEAQNSDLIFACLEFSCLGVDRTSPQK